MKSRLLGIASPKNKRLLKEDAVPSLHLHKRISQLDISVTRNERVDRRGRKRAVDVMLYDSSSNIELDQGDIQQKRRMTQLIDIMLVVIQQ
ncbi:hypothetical protein Pmani_010168 [Petrolisthes manimaculis]|uniref:Uncharacterized protein n=1 Tax=Petrolisthes manimaculis TaxID=1843537 RepID=A0AAE1UFV9_9EUCA|nr:hypothetical protein Pmani_010168 [Petrolisthes manimaculis]